MNVDFAAQRGFNTLIKEQKFTFEGDYESWSFSKSQGEPWGIIKANVSESVWFHIDSTSLPHEAWIKLESLFGKVNTIQAMQIEPNSQLCHQMTFPQL